MTPRGRTNSSLDSLCIIKGELQNQLKKAGQSGIYEEGDWESDEHIRGAYEFGSRCAFLFWELVEKGRMPEEYVSDFLVKNNPFAYQFQLHLNHGVMNSLHIPKCPNEKLIHVEVLMDTADTNCKQALFDYIKKDPDLSRIVKTDPLSL